MASPTPPCSQPTAFQTAFTQALNDPNALQYSVSEGYKPLRDWIVTQMANLGIPCTADNILITSGSQQALDYLGKLMISPADTVLVGWPTYLGALGAFNAYEPTYDRLDPNANRRPTDLAADFAAQAEAAGGRVKFAYLSVDFANPTGETLNRAARESVLDLADTLDIAVVEDAAYQTLRYDGEAIPPILALEIARKGSIENCRTLYCGSFSKSLAPGLRVGWVCGAAEVISRLVLMKQAADLHSSTINQIATNHVARAMFDPHVATLRQTYGARRDHMLAALQREMPQDRHLDQTRRRHVHLADPAPADRRRRPARPVAENRTCRLRPRPRLLCRRQQRQHPAAQLLLRQGTRHRRRHQTPRPPDPRPKLTLTNWHKYPTGEAPLACQWGPGV